MNAWVKRSLSASFIAGGFVVLGAGVANAAEPGDTPNVGSLGQESKGAARDVVRSAGATVERAREQASAREPSPEAKAEPRGGEPAGPTGQRPAERPSSEQVASAKDAEPVQRVSKAAADAGEAVRSVRRDVSEAAASDQAEGAEARRSATPVAAAAEVTRTADATRTLASATADARRAVPVTVDLGDHGSVRGLTEGSGAVDQATEGAVTADELYGITSISGVLGTASTLSAEVPHLVTVDGSSVSTATVDGVLDATATDGHAHLFGAVVGSLTSANALDVDAGDLGYLSTTADLSGWLDGFGDLAADLRSGDVWGVLAAAGGVDGVLTADGQLAHLAGMSTVLTTSAVLDGFVEAAGNLTEGDLYVLAGLFGTLDGAADGTGWVAGLGDFSLSSTLSAALDETLELIEVSLR